MLLDSIDNLIRKEEPDQNIKNYIFSHSEGAIDRDRFIEYFYRVRPSEIPDGVAYSVSGSGGSRIAKPNLSSITCLYIAALEKVRIVKVGSRAKTGMYGSTDFFRDLGVNANNQKKKFIDRFFAYYDTYEIWPWAQYLPSLLSDPAFFDLWSRCEVYPIHYHHKLTGILGWNMVKDRNEFSVLNPNHLSRFWTVVNNRMIDELCVGENYIDNNRVQVSQPLGDLQLRLIQSANECKQINTQLLMGECTDLFWSESLKLSFSLSALQFNLFSEYGEATEAYDKLIKDRSVIKLIEVLQRLS